MELNHGKAKSYFSASQNGELSFQWKIEKFYRLPDFPISSPEFYYKDNSDSWFLKLASTTVDHTYCLQLDLYNNSNEESDFTFAIAVSTVSMRRPFYEHRGSVFSFSKLRPANLIPNMKLPPITFLPDTIDINCSVKASGLEVESHIDTVTSMYRNLKSSESESYQQSSSNQIHTNSGKADRKEQGAHSHLKQKKMDESTVKIADSVPERAQSSGTENTPDDSPDFETLKQLSIDFKRMLTQAMSTDVTFRVEDTTIKAHKAILCARSPVFCRMFEHSTLEAANNELQVTDIRVSVMKKLINYLYCGEKGCLQYEEACELYNAADKCEILCLKEACMKDLLSLLDVNNACPMLSLAYHHRDDAFKELIVNFISKNFNSIVNTESWIQLTEQNTKLAAFLIRYCAGALTK